MDYKAIYYKIIEKAKKETENGNRHVGYFEKHHILPKSLGGSNDKNNLVKLTAREHFICHWLLVKIYDVGTNERYKMICAFWRMKNRRSKYHKEHYINSRAYEALRIEFAKSISKLTSVLQKGNRNSQFGTKWYTNRNTGECKKFKEKPIEEFWIKGRNLFHGEFSNIKLHNNSLIKNKEVRLNKAKLYWNEFHSGNYTSIRDYARQKNTNQKVMNNFFKLIPMFKKVFIPRSHNNGSKPEYVNVYE